MEYVKVVIRGRVFYGVVFSRADSGRVLLKECRKDGEVRDGRLILATEAELVPMHMDLHYGELVGENGPLE